MFQLSAELCFVFQLSAELCFVFQLFGPETLDGADTTKAAALLPSPGPGP